jgi:hypothetical protein
MFQVMAQADWSLARNADSDGRERNIVLPRAARVGEIESRRQGFRDVKSCAPV